MRTSDFASIVTTERLILIDFYATWCGACRIMDPTLARVALAMSDMVTVVRIDISSASNSVLVRRYNIVSVPALMLFHRGEPIWRDSGVIAIDRLCAIIRRRQTVDVF